MTTDVLIIGSSAAGMVAATTAKRIYKNKKVLAITRNQQTLIPCGIPYVFGSVNSTGNNILPAEKAFDNLGVEVIHSEVNKINRTEKQVILVGGEIITYEKLILATGSTPTHPKWLNGSELKQVFYVPKDKEYLDLMQEQIKKCKKVAVIGAGFIGVELSDELQKTGIEVILIEKLPSILGLAFDPEFGAIAENLLTARGVKVIKGMGVKEIQGHEKAEKVVFEDGSSIDIDAVVIAMGYQPSTQLALDAGLPVSDTGFIKVDEYMRTNDPDIFAIGDCAEKRDFVTRKPSPIMLASTACAEARIAGMNLYKLSAIKTFSGTISIFATAIGNTGIGVAGLTESVARSEGFDIITGVFEGIDRHPGSLNDTHKQMVKLIVGKESGVILGGEVAGGLSIGELTNMIGIIIQNRMSINSILTAQIGTHPLLTASPAGYPLIKAAENASAQILEYFNH